MTNTELHEYFHYDEIEGKLIWKKQSGKCKIGEEAGYISSDGYRYFGFKGKTLKTHRAIYLMKTGILPKFVDHEDQNRLNNKWGNLRDATMTDNNRNCGLQKNNQSGVVGVSWSASRKKWVAMIWHESKPIPLGRFLDKQEAIKARKDAEIFYGYHPNHGRGDV
jgi:hypothetical protein